MKEYPSIDHLDDRPDKFGEYCFLQKKYDGSNLRCEWHYKKGFTKFGSRTRMLDRTDPILGVGIDLFLLKYGEGLSKIFSDTREYKEKGQATCYFEFFGPNSFAGTHKPEDEKTVQLFDINLYRFGFLDPRELYKNFSSLDLPEIIYEGKLTKKIFDDVRNAVIVPEFSEGCIAKGGYKHRIWMRKIKTISYITKLKNTIKDWEKYI